MNNLLEIKNLYVCTEKTDVLKSINLQIQAGRIHAIMGPNGSGKSSLALTLMGHPGYKIKQGSISFQEKPIHKLPPDKRAKLGIFLSMQHATEIQGVAYRNFLRQTYDALYKGTEKELGIQEFYKMLSEKAALLNIDQAFLNRSINVGFSGGEKKRAELLQLAVFQPKLAILDEPDSGLDVDALKLVCQALATIKQANPDMAIILITHYQRILNHIHPDRVHVLQNGTITQSGDIQLVHHIEAHGYGD